MFECELQQWGNIFLLIISASLKHAFLQSYENGALLHGCNWPFTGQTWQEPGFIYSLSGMKDEQGEDTCKPKMFLSSCP